MAQISLEEAIRLGLVPEEELQRLAAMGILGSPFARTAGRGTTPFWRIPPITRGGLFQPRFGLGPLSQGLALSPAAPAISGGGVPVGRRNQARNQGPPPLETLIGAGDVNEIARRVASGEVNPNQLPPALRQQVLQILQAQRRQPDREQGGANVDAQKSLAVAKQVLSIARSLVPSGSGAAKIIEQQAQQVAGGAPAEAGPEVGATQGLAAQPEIPSPGGAAPTGPGADRAKLEELGFTPEQIAQIANAIPSGATGQIPMGSISLNGQPESFSPMTGAGTGGILVRDPQGAGYVPIPAEIQQAIDSGLYSAADVRALANQGFTADEIQGALVPSGGLDLESGGDVGDLGPVGSGQETSVGPGIIGGAMGAMTIGQAIADPNANNAQKALRATSGAAQIGAAAAPAAGYAGAVPYLSAAAGLAQIGATAAGPGPSDQKAASAAIDAAAAAVSVGLAMTGYGAVLIPFVQPIASLVKMNIMKAFGLDHKTREAIETQTTGNMANRFIDQIQATKSEGELYDKIRAWSTPLVGGATEKNDPRLNGLDPIMPVNVYASGPGGPDWNYLGLYGAGGLNPNAPTPQQFFDRILQNPDDLHVQIQAGIKPELMGPMNAAILANLREQIAELRVREYVRPNLLAFSKMAGVIVSEDDIVDALRQTRGVIDSPEFPNLLRQAERDRAAREATTHAMAIRNQPFLAPPEYGTVAGLTGPGEMRQYLEQQAAANPVVDAASFPNDPDTKFDIEGEQARQQAYAQLAQEMGPVEIPARRYRAAEAGYTFKPGVGWVDAQGTVAFATEPLPAPQPFVEPAPVPQPPSTATPISAPAPGTSGVPAPTGQSAVPPESPLAPNEPPVPLGIMDQGGIIPQSGLYKLQQGEIVVPATMGDELHDDPERYHRTFVEAGGKAPLQYPNMDQGGIVPASGLYAMQAGEQVIPRGDASGIPDRGRLEAWNIDGHILPSTTEPQPALKDPSMFWIQDEENQWHLVDPRDYEPAPNDSELRDQRSYYLDPKLGVPFQAGSNPEPSKTWRLVFNPEDLHGAWKNRQKDGAPILVPRSVLDRRDWSDVVEKARQSQYVAVHPAILLAREQPQGALGGPPGAAPVIQDDENEDAIRRFWKGEEASQPAVPTPEKTAPMRQLPGRRPMTDDELKQIDWGGENA